MVKLEWEQFRLIETQLRELTQQQRQALREARRGSEESTVSQRKAALPTELRGVGDIGAYVLPNTSPPHPIAPKIERRPSLTYEPMAGARGSGSLA